MTFGPISLLAAIGAFLFITLAFLTPRMGAGNPVRTRLFAGFLLAFSLTLLNVVVADSGLATTEPRLLFIGNTLGLAAAPLLYLFARSLAYSDFRLRRRQLIHFSPLAVIAAVVAWQYHFQPVGTQQAILSGAESGSWLDHPGFALAIFAYPLAYLVLTARVAWRYEDASREARSASDGRELRWLLISVAGMLVGAALSIAHYAVTNVVPVRWLAVLLIAGLGMGALALGVYFLVSAFRSLQSVPPLPAQTAPAGKYGEHRLTNAELEEYAAVLQSHMEAENPHLDPALSLEGLAERLPMTARELSQTINRVHGQSFYEFVARWRVEVAKALLQARPEATVSVVMLDSGFTSKSSFASAFRRETGLTPTAWRERNAGSNTRPRTT